MFDGSVICYTCNRCKYNWGVLENLIKKTKEMQACYNCESVDIDYVIKDISDIDDNLMVDINHSATVIKV